MAAAKRLSSGGRKGRLRRVNCRARGPRVQVRPEAGKRQAGCDPFRHPQCRETPPRADGRVERRD